MRALLIFLVVSALCACSKTAEVPADQYAIVFQMGKIEKVITGPAKIDTNIFLSEIKFINKKEAVSLLNRKFLIQYEVTDPKSYYIKTGGKGALLIEHKINETAAKMALNGVTISDRKRLIEIIENLKLPIRIVN